ncbi:MAG: hypothetical protein V4550_10725 [Gemmatimonadota bacterium]
MRAAAAPALALALAAAACDTPTAPTVLVYRDRPIEVAPASTGWKAVSVGAAHSCGIRLDGALYCWGSNASGQLGVDAARGKCGRFRSACEAGPRAVAPTLRFLHVSAGQRHTCAITTERRLYCWGDNVSFQVGVQGEFMVFAPTPIMPEAQFLDVGAGLTHTCAVRTNGVVYCFGDGTLGALGFGDTTTSVFPRPIDTQERFTRVSAGRLRSCAIALDGAAWCWGLEWESADGGFEYYHQRLSPHRINALPALRSISVSAISMCAVSVEGISLCWEANSFGQLGDGTTAGTATPTPVATDDRFLDVSSGIIQSCGTRVDGVAFCWGNNSFGQLGVPRPGEFCGSLECSRRPIAVFGQQRFVSIVTGLGNHSCGVSSTTAVLCWGLGADGQLGDGFTRDRQSLPVGVLAPTP